MSLEGRIDAAIDAALVNRIVGCVVLVNQGGAPVYARAAGLADREAGRPMAIDTIFRLSSVTKPIVATAILAMVDAGEMGLDDPVTVYLPRFRPRLADGSEPRITIRHLLTHTSGLSVASILSADEQAAGVNRWRLGDDEIIRRLGELPLSFAPGTGWAYGPSIDVLGHIAGRLANGRLDDALRRLVTGPLGMADTGFAVPERSRLAVAYADGPNGPERMGHPHTIPNYWGGTTTYDPERMFDPLAFQSGGGGATGSGPDILRLLEALRDGGGPVLRPETTALALSNQTPQLENAAGPGWQFSLIGALLADAAAARVQQSPGTNRWGGIYGHHWFIDPVREFSVVCMTNTGLEGSDGRLRDDLRAAVYGGPA
ncbi:serine hydrolase domain-containing protein [Devosia sp.]|uniref:serine hydrolase domain-containing protein n=1 Tax=Devosia sp. TaxID=1871048 RepID=UPI0035AE9B8B